MSVLTASDVPKGRTAPVAFTEPSYAALAASHLQPSDPTSLLFNYSVPYEEKIALLKEWRDERTRFLHECCRDMDYINDLTMESILQALHTIRKEPRRHQ